MVNIVFCENNFIHGTEAIVDRIREHLPNAEVFVESCIGYCGDCAEGPFALVNDGLVQADTPDELYEKIKEYF